MATLYKYKCIITINSGYKKLTNDWFIENVFGRQGEAPFEHGLSVSGNGNPEVLWMSCVIQDWQLKKILQYADTNPENEMKICIWPRSTIKGGRKHSDLSQKVNSRNYVEVKTGPESNKSFLSRNNLKVVKKEKSTGRVNE